MDGSEKPVISRRNALVAGLAAVAGVTVVSPVGKRVGGLISPAGAAPGGHADLTLERFTPHVGSTFDVRLGGLRTERVTLAEATAGSAHPDEPRGIRGSSFSLLFRGGGRSAFPHGTFTVRHPALGTFPLFLVAVGSGRNGGQGYEAVVSHRVPTG